MARNEDEAKDIASMVITIEEAATICGCTATWLRKLERDGYFDKAGRGQVRLGDAIRAIERSILGVKRPMEGGF